MTNPPSVGQFWTLAPGKHVLGREPAADVGIVLPWLAVSRRHAQLEYSIGAWEITDQGRNGTSVNGQRLQPNSPTLLMDGDRIQITDLELVFCFQLDAMTTLPKVNTANL